MHLIKPRYALLALFLVCPCIGHAASHPALTATMPEHTLFSAPETHLPLRLRPGKAQVVRLDSEVGDVTVDDMPKNITAVVYEKTSIALVPHNPGAAHFTVFGKDGKPLMARYVVIAENAQKYARIHQTCRKETDVDCEKTYVYYCPNLCYKTHIVGAAEHSPATK